MANMSRLASAYDIMQTNSSPVPVSLKPPPKPWLTPWPPSVIRSPVRPQSPNLRTISTRPCGFRSSFQPSRRDHCGGSDPPRGGGKWCPDPCPPLPSPVPHQRPKRGGRSLHFLPLPCGAADAPCKAGTRGAGAALRFTVEDSGNPCQPTSNADFQAQPGPQRRGLCPLIVQICSCQNRAPPACATPAL